MIVLFNSNYNFFLTHLNFVLTHLFFIIRDLKSNSKQGNIAVAHPKTALFKAYMDKNGTVTKPWSIVRRKNRFACNNVGNVRRQVRCVRREST